ncbi:unnamed protein product [Macrosiphum euphorbiae]|uniref:Uncharacterized protein n=1 Tax=Macrosiphum euphorbiae TaxID=13131 RepID=A0AAV0WKA9_9HEMI|nr:unnamed protein product [Macrosiphum euphorbiae]
MNSMEYNENERMDVICNPIENDEVCMKMPTAQQLTLTSTESIANKIQQLYSMFVSQADVPNREPSNKNVDKQLRFYSTKKPRTKAPEEQRLNKPTIQVINQIKNDLKGNDTPYINIDPHFEHSYGQLDQKKK